MKFHLSKRTKKLNKAASLIKNYKYMYIKMGGVLNQRRGKKARGNKTQVIKSERTANASDKPNSVLKYMAINYRKESISHKSERFFFYIKGSVLRNLVRLKSLLEKTIHWKCLAVRM